MRYADGDREFASKVDTWLVLFVGASITVGLAAVLTVLWAEPSSWIVVIPMAVATVWFPVWIFRSTRYTLTARDLRIRSGPFRWTIPLADVHTVRSSRNPLSSPALSLDRLEIRYGHNRTIRISPDDKDAFLTALDARRASLENDRSSGS
jgi:membrane protein YdbS with pleckstrin-like domain